MSRIENYNEEQKLYLLYCIRGVVDTVEDARKDTTTTLRRNEGKHHECMGYTCVYPHVNSVPRFQFLVEANEALNGAHLWNAMVIHWMEDQLLQAEVLEGQGVLIPLAYVMPQDGDVHEHRLSDETLNQGAIVETVAREGSPWSAAQWPVSPTVVWTSRGGWVLGGEWSPLEGSVVGWTQLSALPGAQLYSCSRDSVNHLQAAAGPFSSLPSSYGSVEELDTVVRMWNTHRIQPGGNGRD
ncbi:hypothetical protein N1851_012374 [Merluccius polli]|uniref:Uncharacterized protein n=1 Tax=Merluccius polli TaxID=89951 RepID=A0AA47MWC1_MERPO|nr:hypothetical protein N1851_012374 [Merluccius polli]